MNTLVHRIRPRHHSSHDAQERLTSDQKDLARFAIREGIFLHTEKFSAAKRSLFSTTSFCGERVSTKHLLDGLISDGWSIDCTSLIICKGKSILPLSLIGYWGIRYAMYLCNATDNQRAAVS